MARQEVCRYHEPGEIRVTRPHFGVLALLERLLACILRLV